MFVIWYGDDDEEEEEVVKDFKNVRKPNEKERGTITHAQNDWQQNDKLLRNAFSQQNICFFLNLNSIRKM